MLDKIADFVFFKLPGVVARCLVSVLFPLNELRKKVFNIKTVEIIEGVDTFRTESNTLYYFKGGIKLKVPFSPSSQKVEVIFESGKWKLVVKKL